MGECFQMMDKDFAYLLGALGDGCLVHRKNKGEYCIEYEQKIESWLSNSILPRVERLYGKSPKVKQRKSKLYRIRLYSKKAFFEISSSMQNLDSLLNENSEVKSHFIRGFFDAEGSVPKRKQGMCYRLEIYQKDTSKLELISKMLSEDFGIIPNKITNSRDIGQLNVRTRENISRFKQAIGSEHPLKSQALENLF